MKVLTLLICSILAAHLSSCTSYQTDEAIHRYSVPPSYLAKPELANNQRQRSVVTEELSTEERKRQQNNRNMLNPLETMARGRGYINQILR